MNTGATTPSVARPSSPISRPIQNIEMKVWNSPSSVVAIAGHARRSSVRWIGAPRIASRLRGPPAAPLTSPLAWT